VSDERDDDFGFDEDAEREWRGYLSHFRDNVYPMFRDFGVSFDAALTCWFVNRLRNAIPDDDAGNDPWKK
jgi:hypothetical protein